MPAWVTTEDRAQSDPLHTERVGVQKSAQAEVVMRQELEDGVNFISAAHRMRARFGPQTTRRQQIQALDTVRFAVGLNIGPIRHR